MLIIDDENEYAQQKSCSSFDVPGPEELREEIESRKSIILSDKHEFRRVQAELRKSGVQTSMGTKQLLGQKMAKSLIEKRKRRSSMPADIMSAEESLDQRATRTMMQRRATEIYGEKNNNNNSRQGKSAVSKMMERMSFVATAKKQDRRQEPALQRRINSSEFDDDDDDDDLQILKAVEMMNGIGMDSQ